MPKYTKKWEKDFEKRYSNAIKELSSLEQEFKEMKDSNPDKWVSVSPNNTEIDFGENNGYYISHYKENENKEYPKEHVDISIQSELGMFGFHFSSFQDLINFRNNLIEAIDNFQRPVEEKVVIDPDDDCEDSEDAEIQKWTIKAEQPLTQSWTYTVSAKSACEAVKMVEDDAWQDGVKHNDDNEYYDYGEIEYEAI